MAEMKAWVLAYGDSPNFDRAEMDAAIMGKWVDGRLKGGIMSRARCVYKIQGRPLASVTRQFQHDCDEVPLDVSSDGTYKRKCV